jgi:hypothetical protein
VFAFLGNFVGAAIFVAGAYWFLYARPEDEGTPGDEPKSSGVSGEPEGRQLIVR